MEKIISQITATCPTHGVYQTIKVGNVTLRCPHCESLDVEKRQQQEASLKLRQRMEELSVRLKMACIPKRFLTRSLNSFVATTPEQRKVLDFATDYAQNFATIKQTGTSAVFLGRPGTGKTHLAVGIALDIIQRGYTAAFCTVTKCIRRIKNTWSHLSNETETQAIESYTAPDLLILDEVGANAGSLSDSNILFEIINERYSASLPTILISNLPIDTLVKYLGERIIDRIEEDGGRIVLFTWRSHREQSQM